MMVANNLREGRLCTTPHYKQGNCCTASNAQRKAQRPFHGVRHVFTYICVQQSTFTETRIGLQIGSKSSKQQGKQHRDGTHRVLYAPLTKRGSERVPPVRPLRGNLCGHDCDTGVEGLVCVYGSTFSPKETF